MRHRNFTLAILTMLMLARLASPSATRALPQQKDYLSDEEADKIRDALTPAERIRLYLLFAEDRLKKFDYELNRSTPERRRAEVLNNLMNGCRLRRRRRRSNRHGPRKTNGHSRGAEAHADEVPGISRSARKIR